MGNEIEIFLIFKNILNVIDLLNSSKALSKELECETICQFLKLKYIQVGGDFFSSFEIFGMKSKKTSALNSNIEQIIKITENDKNGNKKSAIENCLKKISIMVNQIISVCDENQVKNNHFINSVFESSNSCKNEIETNENDIKKLQSEIEKLKNHNLSIIIDIKKFFQRNSSNINEVEINSKSKEIMEKKISIENIKLIIKNFESIEKEIKYNIDFFKLIKKSWILINDKFENISNNINFSNEWILEEIKKIIPHINKLIEQLNSIEIEIKKLENQFNILFFTKDANIINQ